MVGITRFCCLDNNGATMSQSMQIHHDVCVCYLNLFKWHVALFHHAPVSVSPCMSNSHNPTLKEVLSEHLRHFDVETMAHDWPREPETKNQMCVVFLKTDISRIQRDPDETTTISALLEALSQR